MMSDKPNDKFNSATQTIGYVYDGGAVIVGGLEFSRKVTTGTTKAFGTHNTIVQIPLQTGQVIAGYNISVKEGNVQLGGAVGTFGGGVLGGVIAGAIVGGASTGPGAPLGILLGGIAGAVIGEAGVEWLVSEIQNPSNEPYYPPSRDSQGRWLAGFDEPGGLGSYRPAYTGNKEWGLDSPSEHRSGPGQPITSLSSGRGTVDPTAASKGNGYDGPGSAGQVPSHLTGSTSNTGSYFSDLGGGGSPDAPKPDTPKPDAAKPAPSQEQAAASTPPVSPQTSNADSYFEDLGGGGSSNASKPDGSSWLSNTISTVSNWATGGDNDSADSLADKVSKSLSDFASSIFDPVALDLDGDGKVAISTLDKSGVRFDWENDGDLLSTAWVGAQDGYLMIDDNQDRRLTHASEIAFADRTFAEDTDLEAIGALFDSNDDGLLDMSDEDWAGLAVWQDGNQNGATDAGEVQSLSAWGITALDVVSDGNRYGLADGSIIHGASQMHLGGGTSRTILDVGLAAQDMLDGDEMAMEQSQLDQAIAEYARLDQLQAHQAMTDAAIANSQLGSVLPYGTVM
jgi:hypothetical protein